MGLSFATLRAAGAPLLKITYRCFGRHSYRFFFFSTLDNLLILKIVEFSIKRREHTIEIDNIFTAPGKDLVPVHFRKIREKGTLENLEKSRTLRILT